MNEVWFIGDTHFGHANILKFEPIHRPFATIQEHNEQLIENWNSVVKKNDTIWHLGDVCFGLQTLHNVLPRLQGNKRLILGNHDCYSIREYMVFFPKIFGVVKTYEFILSHVPLHPGSIPSRASCNIHGHLHSKKIDSPLYYNVSVEHHNLTPVNLEQVREDLKHV